MLKEGIKGKFESSVTEQFCAGTLGSGTMDVLGTPGLIAFAERCAWESVHPFLEEGEGTVGISMEMKQEKERSTTPIP